MVSPYSDIGIVVLPAGERGIAERAADHSLVLNGGIGTGVVCRRMMLVAHHLVAPGTHKEEIVQLPALFHLTLLSHIREFHGLDKWRIKRKGEEKEEKEERTGKERENDTHWSEKQQQQQQQQQEINHHNDIMMFIIINSPSSLHLTFTSVLSFPKNG